MIQQIYLIQKKGIKIGRMPWTNAIIHFMNFYILYLKKIMLEEFKCGTNIFAVYYYIINF